MMGFVDGCSLVVGLQPECRFDPVVEALGGHGGLVRRPGVLRPVLGRASA
jgi:acetolactate synthase I/II/III large subunit